LDRVGLDGMVAYPVRLKAEGHRSAWWLPQLCGLLVGPALPGTLAFHLGPGDRGKDAPDQPAHVGREVQIAADRGQFHAGPLAALDDILKISQPAHKAVNSPDHHHIDRL
jgi:hypothetical protein